MKFKKSFVFYFLLLFATSDTIATQKIETPKYIIFCISDVLLKPSMNGVPFARIAKIAGFSIEYVRKLLLDTLGPLHAPQFRKFDAENPPIIAYWLTTPYSSDYAKNIAMQYINQHSRFIRRKILQRAVETAFTPSEAAKVLQINHSMLSIFNLCKQKGNHIYVCDNMNVELLGVIRSRYKSIFTLSKGFHISGNTGLLMSEPAFFKQMLDTYKIDAKECCVIVASPLAASSARTAGMKAILYRGDSGMSVINALRSFGAIS